jgi:arylsulfatase A-like enzyme
MHHQNPDYAAMVQTLDDNVGRVIDRLEQRKLADRTLVIFTSDNGGEPGLVAPLRGSKGSLDQGGLRVPMVAAGPGIRAGAHCGTTVLSMDIFPTLLEYARIPLPPCDGSSLRPLLAGAPGFPDRDLFWHFPCYTGRFGPGSAIRSGDCKLIEHFEDGRIELFDLAADPNESHDLSRSDPERTRKLLARLHAWQDATGAPRPTAPNPAFDPGTTKQRRRDAPRSPGGFSKEGRSNPFASMRNFPAW